MIVLLCGKRRSREISLSRTGTTPLGFDVGNYYVWIYFVGNVLLHEERFVSDLMLAIPLIVTLTHCIAYLSQ